MLLTTTVSAALLYWSIGHPTGFPWNAAPVAGALLAATDPVAVVTQLKTLGAPERLAVILKGESCSTMRLPSCSSASFSRTCYCHLQTRM